jgi:hypothetical protein
MGLGLQCNVRTTASTAWKRMCALRQRAGAAAPVGPPTEEQKGAAGAGVFAFLVAPPLDSPGIYQLFAPSSTQLNFSLAALAQLSSAHRSWLNLAQLFAPGPT